ncbi:MAG TPA: hypothetical protein DHV28_11235 [Ignavibacteriales bacterium]|nr:hypothetical protein [Ignavibacteriales bacterium]
MCKIKHYKAIEEYITNLSDKDFTNFCDRLLHKVFPEAVRSCSISENGYTNINNNVFLVIPSEYEEEISLESILPNDLAGMNPVSITFLSKDSFNASVDQKKKMRESLGNIRIETWGIETFKIKLSSFNEDEQNYIIDDKSLFTNYLTSVSDQSEGMDIIHNIFKYIKSNAKPIKSIPDIKAKEFKGIIKKIKLNFSKYQSRVKDMYELTYYYKTLVEKYIQETTKHDKSEIIALKEFFRSTYCEITNYSNSTHPVNEFKFLELLSDACLEPKYRNDKKHQLFAKSIVMYFFEYCDFGARNKKDIFVQENPTFFDNYNKDLS